MLNPTPPGGSFPSSNGVPGRLSALQERVLRALAELDPRRTRSGGGALAGFHLGHRATKDVALFFHGLK